MGMAVDDRLECFGDVGGRGDVVEIAGSDDRSEQGPVFGSDLMTGEERIFSAQADWPDGVLDRVGVELEAPVFEEAGQTLPVIERVADVLGERRTAGDHRQLFFEPRLQRGYHWQRVLLARGQPYVRRCTAHHGFDGVKLCDVPNGGLGDRRFAVTGQFAEAPAQMAPAMHERPRPLRSSDFGQPVITVIGVALQEVSAKAIQELLRKGTAATGGISEQHDRRTWAAVAAVVGDDRPEVPFLRVAAPWIEYWRRGFVHEQTIRHGQAAAHVVRDGLEMEASAAGPVAQCRPIKPDPLAR